MAEGDVFEILGLDEEEGKEEEEAKERDEEVMAMNR